MAEDKTYAERTVEHLAKQCERRGIAEVDDVKAALAAKYGKPVEELNESQLKRLNRELEPFMIEYLGGKKRR